MACTGTAITEYQFILQDPPDDRCHGPLIRLKLTRPQLEILAACPGDTLRDLLWSEPGDGDTTFSLCARHWFVVARDLGLLARVHSCFDAYMLAVMLVAQVCLDAGWDGKEICNMLSWRAAVTPAQGA